MFKTHNHTSVSSDGTCGRGYIKATYRELTSLFGEPMPGDGHKSDAEWVIKFDDGTIATIYNWKDGVAYLGSAGKRTKDITKWGIGGSDHTAPDKIQILLELHRERIQASKRDEFETAFEDAMHMMQSIKDKHGVPFADCVESTMLTMKIRDLFGLLLSDMLSKDLMPQKVTDELWSLLCQMQSRSLAVTYKYALSINNVDTRHKKRVEEIVDWAERLINTEQTCAKSMFNGSGHDQGQR
jgi:hypothetical protein